MAPKRMVSLVILLILLCNAKEIKSSETNLTETVSALEGCVTSSTTILKKMETTFTDKVYDLPGTMAALMQLDLSLRTFTNNYQHDGGIVSSVTIESLSEACSPVFPKHVNLSASTLSNHEQYGRAMLVKKGAVTSIFAGTFMDLSNLKTGFAVNNPNGNKIQI